MKKIAFIILAAFIFHSCSKDNKSSAPGGKSVSLNDVSNLTCTSGTFGLSFSGFTIMPEDAAGILIEKTANPTLNPNSFGDTFMLSVGKTSYSKEILDLEPSTKYYYRAFYLDSGVEVYSDVKEFTTPACGGSGGGGGGGGVIQSYKGTISTEIKYESFDYDNSYTSYENYSISKQEASFTADLYEDASSYTIYRINQSKPKSAAMNSEDKYERKVEKHDGSIKTSNSNLNGIANVVDWNSYANLPHIRIDKSAQRYSILARFSVLKGNSTRTRTYSHTNCSVCDDPLNKTEDYTERIDVFTRSSTTGDTRPILTNINSLSGEETWEVPTYDDKGKLMWKWTYTSKWTFTKE